jgi:hypothetical protein
MNETLLKAFRKTGLYDHFSNLSRDDRDRLSILMGTAKTIDVVRGKSLPKGRESASILTKLQKAMSKLEIDIGEVLTKSEAFNLVVLQINLEHAVADLTRDPMRNLSQYEGIFRFAEMVRYALPDSEETLSKVWRGCWKVLCNLVSKHTLYDSEIYYVEMNPTKKGVSYSIEYVAPKEERIRLDNRTARVYALYNDGVHMQLHGKLVWVDSHVIRRMKNRLRSPYTQCLLADAVNDSANMPASELNSPGLPIYGSDCKVGYVPLTETPIGYVMRTFRFITMQGCPEGDRLSKLLGLEREDIAALRLDSIDAVGLTRDSKLSDIMIQAGLQDLVVLADVFANDKDILEANRELFDKDLTFARQYLGLDSQDNSSWAADGESSL